MPKETAAPFKLPQLSLDGQQAVHRAAEQIVADSRQAPDQHTSLATRLDEILGSARLFVAR